MIWEAAFDGKIVESDVSIVKNYLSDKEMFIVSLYLDYAESQAECQISMSIEDLARRLDIILNLH